MQTTLKNIQKHGGKSIDLGKQNGEPVFYYFGGLLPEQYCDDVNRSIRHTGWFTNEHGETYKDGSGKARGIVINLPARPGFPDGVYLAGYFWGDTGERVVWPECFSDSDDAANTADGYAESFADDEREHAIKWNAAQDLGNAIETELHRLRECLALRNVNGFDDAREEIPDLIESIRDKRETLKTEFKDFV